MSLKRPIQDVEILQTISQNPNVKITDLAKRLGIARSTIARRIAMMRKRGKIKTIEDWREDLDGRQFWTSANGGLRCPMTTGFDYVTIHHQDKSLRSKQVSDTFEILITSQCEFFNSHVVLVMIWNRSFIEGERLIDRSDFVRDAVFDLEFMSNSIRSCEDSLQDRCTDIRLVNYSRRLGSNIEEFTFDFEDELPLWLKGYTQNPKIRLSLNDRDNFNWEIKE